MNLPSFDYVVQLDNRVVAGFEDGHEVQMEVQFTYATPEDVTLNTRVIELGPIPDKECKTGIRRIFARRAGIQSGDRLHGCATFHGIILSQDAYSGSYVLQPTDKNWLNVRMQIRRLP
jgi:hypothetical protein